MGLALRYSRSRSSRRRPPRPPRKRHILTVVLDVRMDHRCALRAGQARRPCRSSAPEQPAARRSRSRRRRGGARAACARVSTGRPLSSRSMRVVVDEGDDLEAAALPLARGSAHEATSRPKPPAPKISSSCGSTAAILLRDPAEIDAAARVGVVEAIARAAPSRPSAPGSSRPTTASGARRTRCRARSARTTAARRAR